MKFLLFLLLSTQLAHAQGFQDLWGLVSPGNKVPGVNNQNTTQQTKKYQFITPPKDKKTGSFRVTCYLNSGMAMPGMQDVQVKQIDVSFLNYTYITINDKVIQAPIDKCVNIQN